MAIAYDPGSALTTHHTAATAIHFVTVVNYAHKFCAKFNNATNLLTYACSLVSIHRIKHIFSITVNYYPKMLIKLCAIMEQHVFYILIDK